MQDPFEDYSEVFFALCKSVNTPFSLGAWLRWKHREMLTQPRPNPKDYDNAHSFGQDYLVSSWASKAQLAMPGANPRENAIASFITDEQANSITNRRLKVWSRHGEPPCVSMEIHAIRRKIASILGPLSKLRVLEQCRFGNGATASLARRHARIDKKITTVPLSVSPRALNLSRAVVESDLHWLRCILEDSVTTVEGPCSLLPCCFEVTDYNVLDTVPKNFKTDRTIAKEPTLNGFLQQGVHCYLRDRLKRAGIDLRNQTTNQNLASIAQEQELSTIDLESASNSVTTNLVKLLFPEDWFDFLDNLRSQNTLLPDGTLHKSEMFSSMGNAFTFEVETLVFVSIARVCSCEHPLVSVYGDDIVVPRFSAERTISLLESLGFRVNRSKTFVEGRFFESCGKHYFDGFDVTPVYQKSPPRQNVEETIRSHNRLMRWGIRSGMSRVIDRVVASSCSLLYRGLEKFAAPLSTAGDDFVIRPYGDYVIRRGKVFTHGWSPVVSRRRGRQSGFYAYWLRLRGVSLTRAHIVESDNRTDALVLSEFTDVQGYDVRKKAIPYNWDAVDAVNFY